MLGAERALFRHLKNGSRPPKHGIIYQHPTIHRAPYWQRGKLARTLAGKLAIAAKMDHHSDKFIGDKLEQDFRKRVDEIKKRYPKPPTPPRGKGRGEGKPKRERK
jgi:nucleolar protein 56